MDGRATGLGMRVVLEHQHAAAAGDDEAISVGVIGSRRRMRNAVESTGQRAHRIELRGHSPMQFLTAAGKHHVLCPMPDKVGRGADAVGRGGAGGGDRIAESEDAEGGGERSRHGGTHRARDHVRADPAHALFAQHIARFDLPLRRAAAGSGDHPGPWMADLVLGQAGIGDGIAHGQVAVRGGIAHEAPELAIDFGVDIRRRHAGDLAAQSAADEFGYRADPAETIAQGSRDGVGGIADAGHDAHSRDDDATHVRSPPSTGTGRPASPGRCRSCARRRRCRRRRRPGSACRA